MKGLEWFPRHCRLLLTAVQQGFVSGCFIVQMRWENLFDLKGKEDSLRLYMKQYPSGSNNRPAK